MPVSIPPTPASASAPSASTHLPSTTAKRPVPRDHVFNYTYTYGYNFGYIANGFALIPASKTEQEKQQQGEGPVPLTIPATTPRTTDPGTKFSLTFSSGASEKRGEGSERGKAPTVLLHPSTSVHPFSPYYGAYIELVASGGFSGTDKEERGSEATTIDTRGEQEERKGNKRKRAEGAMDEEMEYFLMPSHGKKAKGDGDGSTSPASASASTSWLSPLSASTSTSNGISLTFQDGSRMTRSPSPADSLRSFGMMEYAERPGGVFTSGAKKGKGQAAKPRPRGLWRARGTGPLPSVLNMNGVPMTGGALLSGISNKKAAPTSDKTTHTKGGTRPKHRRNPETDDDYCSSSSEMSSDGSESSGDGLKNLKRRRVRRGRSRGEEGDVYSDSGSSVSSAEATCSSGSDRDNDDDEQQRRRTKRARRHGQGGNDDDDDARRHQADQIQQAQHKQSRKTLLSASTMETAATPMPPLDDPLDPRYVTRSKVMDTTSLARTRASPDANQVTYNDWEDLKEVWARCLEVVDVEDPSEMVPLLRGIIHECSRFLQAFEDPSVLFIPSHPGNNVERKNSDPSLPTKIDSGIGTDPQPPIDASPALSTQSQSQKPQHVHSKDIPTAFHAILGTALFFFGNLIAASPHLALEGEPKSRAFYHLYVLDVFEMAECIPVRTGMGGVPLTDNECCGLKEDWRMAIVWGRALVSITEELLEREQMSEEIMEARAADEKEKEAESYFPYPRHELLVPSSRSGPPQPDPASFLSEDFVISSGMLGDGYFGGTGGRGMGFSVDGMGGLRVAGNYGMPEQTLQLPSVVFPLTSASVQGERTPSGGASPTPGVSSPFSTLTLGEASSSSTTPGSSTLSTVSDRPATPQARFPYPALSPHTPADDPRRHWKKDSPFVVIRSRMPPVTRRMTLTDAGTSGPGGLLPSPAPITGTAFTTSWWNDDYEDNGRYQGGSLNGESGLPVGKGKAKQKERNKKKHAGPSVDEILTMAVDQFSRGILHMPRTGSLVSSGGVVLDGGKREGHRHHRHKHGHKHHSHHHHHHHRHRHTDTDEADVAAAAGTPPPFSRASHLLTIAMEVLMLAEKLPSAESRYRWASYADNVFEQMRLEESPGVNIIARSGGSDDEEMDVDDDVDGSGGDGGEGRPSRGRSSKHSHGHGSHSKSYSFLRNTSEVDPTHLDSGNNDVILKARGRCALIIGSAVSEESVEVWLEELDVEEEDEDGQGENTPDADKTPAPGSALPSRSERAKAKKKEIEAVLMSEDAEEARGRLRQAVEFFEKARGVWREGVALRRKERERVKERIERDKARASPVSDKKDKGKGRFRIGSPPVKRRGIGALAAENKKRRREAAVKEKEKQMVGVQVDEDAMMDVDVEMGDVSVERRDSGSTAPATPSAIQVESPSGSAQDVSVQAEDEDARLLALFAAEEEEEEAEEREYGRLIAETVVTLANILLVDEEEGDVVGEDVSGVEKATEKEREELYLKAKEEMRRGGIEEVDDMI